MWQVVLAACGRQLPSPEILRFISWIERSLVSRRGERIALARSWLPLFPLLARWMAHSSPPGAIFLTQKQTRNLPARRTHNAYGGAHLLRNAWAWCDVFWTALTRSSKKTLGR